MLFKFLRAQCELKFNYNIEHPAPFPPKFLVVHLCKAKPFLLSFMVRRQTWKEMERGKGFLAKISTHFVLEILEKAL